MPAFSTRAAAITSKKVVEAAKKERDRISIGNKLSEGEGGEKQIQFCVAEISPRNELRK